MADLLHADTMQQLEVALLGSPAAQILDLLSSGWEQAKPASMPSSGQPHPQAYTSTPPAPPSSSMPVVGVLTSSLVVAFSSMSVGANIVESAVPEPKETKATGNVWYITPVLVELSSSTGTTSSLVLPHVSTLNVVVVPELAISAEAYPEQINRPG